MKRSIKAIIFHSNVIYAHRHLEVIAENVLSSKSCKVDCIDQNYNFCPTNTGYTQGICCTEDSCAGKVDICSNEASILKEMQY